VVKKLLAVIVVVVLAGLMAVPAFAQSADLNQVWGSANWGESLFGSDICPTVTQTPQVFNVWQAFVGTMCG
jgi:hypothetical protein